MKFSIPRQSLDKAIQRVLAVVSPKTTLPVLANFLVETNKKQNTISLTATDLDMTVTTGAEAIVEEGGSVTLPAKRFAEIVRELGSADVIVSAEGEEISVRAGKSKFKIVGIPTEEFPSLPKSDRASAFSVDSQMLARMVDKVGFCTSKDETRPSLNGALWEFSADGMGMTATDGHRLATFRAQGDYKSLAGKNLIVPPKALGHTVRIISAEGDGDVSVSVHENHVAFFIGSTTINSRLLEGPFPNYKQVIPKDNDKELIVGRENLTSAVRRVAVLADTLTHQVRMTLSKKKVELVVSTPDVGEAREEVEATFDSDSMEVGYNANYLLDVLKHIDSDEVRFTLGTAVGAAIVSAVEETEGEEYICLLMPLRLTS
ncbi:MAG: DNA polymerase III subunit beta [Candidatus Eisenbacteria bacterium]|nr:DNA polymerase III subunit beta [Candidatus Eisenbacteria bacterium]